MSVISTYPYHSPCGTLLLASYEGRICLCDWAENRRRQLTDRRIRSALHAQYVQQQSEVIAQAVAELDEYFGGMRTHFDVPLLMATGTPFQQRVWQCLTHIPYGTTLSYAEEALRLGSATAVRAVASANGANPLSILVPCHRVIASDGTLGGYAGGLAAKRFLLELEGGRKI